MNQKQAKKTACFFCTKNDLAKSLITAFREVTNANYRAAEKNVPTDLFGALFGICLLF